MNITRVSALEQAGLPGVLVYPVSGKPSRGKVQEVLVSVPAHGLIPLHEHSVDADMLITSGKATVLQAEGDGPEVGIGAQVRFIANVPHGFRAGDSGFSFISKNGGIVDQTRPWDIKF